jgi:hypothetical protein
VADCGWCPELHYCALLLVDCPSRHPPTLPTPFRPPPPNTLQDTVTNTLSPTTTTTTDTTGTTQGGRGLDLPVGQYAAQDVSGTTPPQEADLTPGRGFETQVRVGGKCGRHGKRAWLGMGGKTRRGRYC